MIRKYLRIIVIQFSIQYFIKVSSRKHNMCTIKNIKSTYREILRAIQYIQINTWAFRYWPGYHPETPILSILAWLSSRDPHGSRDDNQANVEMPMY